jgi:hypothetical protein
VATFLPHRQNNMKKKLQYFNDPFKGWCGNWSFFSYYSAYKTKMLPHQPLNGSLKYWIFVPYDEWSGIHPCTGEHHIFCTHKQSPFWKWCSWFSYQLWRRIMLSVILL